MVMELFGSVSYDILAHRAPQIAALRGFGAGDELEVEQWPAQS